MIVSKMKSLSDQYDHVYIVESLLWWDENNELYNPKTDLVLTYDFALKYKVSKAGGQVLYIDHLVDAVRMDKNNFLINKFLHSWFLDAENQDIFQFKGVSFGDSFRLDVWNDFVSYCRLYLCLSQLLEVKIGILYLASSDRVIRDVLYKLNLKFDETQQIQEMGRTYYFPISQWLDDRISPSGLRASLYRIRELISSSYGYVMMLLDKFFLNEKKTIFIQEYHPTRKIIDRLRKDKSVHVLLVNFSRNSKWHEKLSERLLPRMMKKQVYLVVGNQLIEKFKAEKCQSLVLDTGVDISNDVYDVVMNRIESIIEEKLRVLDSCIFYIEKNTVNLEVLIANIGLEATLFDCVCKNRGIPSYLIINGLLGDAFSNESKYASVINSYSQSIKNNYFKGMNNIVALGDPRMDSYARIERKSVNRECPVVVIGTSGFFR